MLTATENIKRIKIGVTDVFIEDFDKGQGKVTVSNTDNKNYSYYWGSMGDGDTIRFLCLIDADYFASKLMGAKSDYVMDIPKTFTAIRKMIATDLELPWYKHIDFQRDMREKLNSFQRDCEDHKSQELFCERFYTYFIPSLDFFLIEDRHEMKSVEKTFKEISEVWNLIQTKKSPEYMWLVDFHGKLKKHLEQLPKNTLADATICQA